MIIGLCPGRTVAYSAAVQTRDRDRDGDWNGPGVVVLRCTLNRVRDKR
jgi:hypothetical protein